MIFFKPNAKLGKKLYGRALNGSMVPPYETGTELLLRWFKKRSGQNRDAGHISIGNRGEDLAVSHLKKKGVRILERNARNVFGELDIVARDKDTVVFVEVKTRTSHAFGDAGEAVDRFKIRRLSRTALYYLAQKAWEDKPARFDVVAVYLDDGKPRLEHMVDAFDLEVG